MKGVLSGGRMVWVDKVPGGNQIGGIMCFTHPYDKMNNRVDIVPGVKTERNIQ